MVFYEWKGLMQTAVLGHLHDLIASSYFGPYETRGKSSIETSLFKMEHIASICDKRDHDFHTLADVKPHLLPLLRGLQEDSMVTLYNANLILYLPELLKRNVGFSEREAERLEMSVSFVAYQYPRTRDDSFIFHAVTDRLRPDKYGDRSKYQKDKRKYDRWLHEVDRELKRILPMAIEHEVRA